MPKPFPTLRLRAALILYRALWIIALPLILIYLWRRGLKDPTYSQHLSERFGRHREMQDTVWIHAVSLGEMRSAVPLIRALLQRGERIVITHFTPAGRREAESVFHAEIAEGRLRAVWVPFEYGWAFARFFRAFRPKYGLVMEIEVWPVMIMESRRKGIPLFMCNAQYPSTSFIRDTTKTKFRGDLMLGFAGAMVKSDLQRDRFSLIGVDHIHVTGELRFEQPIPPHLLTAGQAARDWIAPTRPVVTIASAVEGEDEIYIRAIKTSQSTSAPLFIYVPRKPERFAEVGAMLRAAGLRVAERSNLFDRQLAPNGPAPDVDVILGDSLGEMYFYLTMADNVVAGGGFTPHGAHNVIEPLALKKPVIVGPYIHTIEYPAVEAIAAGVCTHVHSELELANAIVAGPQTSPDQISAFFNAHTGTVQKTLHAIDALTTH
ncbi:MAG TPA: 3-deoxy-D-manno-octulosonic acid transferase [Rhodobacteraceae bacterium]|jgi:3-deoxy-D-manno-octulosonic-acid transferase|nr:3-deoxy-D-manno-octulosonic acid transferase [Paracoccaceae bacterium]